MRIGAMGRAAALAALWGAPAAALEAPDCAALRAWAGEQGPEVAVGAAAALPAPYAAETTAALFGTPFLDWTREDFRAVDGMLNACRSEARKAKDAEATEAFGGARQELARAGRVLRDVNDARAAAAKALATIDAAAPNPDLAAQLRAMAEADPAGAPVAYTYADVGRLARALPALPEAEAAALRTAALERAEAMAGSVAEAGRAALAALPETLEGAVAARAAGLDALARMGDAGAELVAAAEAREAEIAAALAASAAPPIRLPGCAPLLAYGETLDANQTRRAKAGRVLVALEDPALAEWFGKTAEGWTAEDFAALRKLAELCRGAGRAGLLEGDRRTLDRAAGNVVELTVRGGDQPAVFAALAAARAEAEALAAEAAAATALVAVAALRGSPRLRALEEEDAARAAAALEARRAARAAEALAGPLAALAGATADLAGLDAALAALAAVETGPLAAHLTPEEVAAVRTEAAAVAHRAGPAAAPGFAERLAALPADPAGLAEVERLERSLARLPAAGLAPLLAAAAERRTQIADAMLAAELPAFRERLAGLPRTGEGLAENLAVAMLTRLQDDGLPARALYVAAAEEAAEGLRAELAAARCAPVAATLSDRDAARPVLAGTAVRPLARFLCDLADRTDGPPAYAAPGLFGSEHVVTATVSGGFAVKLVLRQRDVPTGGEALIGTRIEDGNGVRDVSVAEWQAWSAEMSASGPEVCAAIDARLAAGLRRGAADPSDAVRLADCLIAAPEAPIRPAG